MEKVWGEQPPYPKWNFLSPAAVSPQLWIHPSMQPCSPEVVFSLFKNPSFLLEKRVLWCWWVPSLLSGLFGAFDPYMYRGDRGSACLPLTQELKHDWCNVHACNLSTSRTQESEAGELPRVKEASLGNSDNPSPETKTGRKNKTRHTNKQTEPTVC